MGGISHILNNSRSNNITFSKFSIILQVTETSQNTLLLESIYGIFGITLLIFIYLFIIMFINECLYLWVCLYFHILLKPFIFLYMYL